MGPLARMLLVALLPLFSAVPVDAYVMCVFRPVTCCQLQHTEEVPDDGCGSCCEEPVEEPDEEEVPVTPTDCCCATTVVAPLDAPRKPEVAPSVRSLTVHLRRLVGRSTPPDTPPPLR